MTLMAKTRALSLTVIAFALAGLGADEPKMQKVSANGITFDAPASWKSSKPSSSMRLAQLKSGPAKGDDEPAELVLFAFPGGAGSVDANLERWRKQFVDDAGEAPKIKTEKRKDKDGGEVVFCETSGRYVAAMTPGSAKTLDKPGWALLGGIVITPKTSYFFKMVGPEATIKEAKPGFEAMIKTISVEE